MSTVKKKSATIGQLAKKNGEYAHVLNDLIFAHEDLKELIEPYMKKVKRKRGSKLLPPHVVEAICAKLGFEY